VKPRESIGSNVCEISTSVNEGDNPVKRLTIVAKHERALGLRARIPTVENFMFVLLARRMNDRDINDAQVDAYFDRLHLAATEAHPYSALSLEFHLINTTD